MAKPTRYIVTCKDGLVGSVHTGDQLIQAIQSVAAAKALGLKGDLVAVFEDGTMLDLDPVTLDFGGARKPADQSPF